MRSGFVSLALIPLALMAAQGAEPQTKPTTFDAVRPILEAKCAKCHNDKVAKADLKLDSVTNILKGGESGPAVIAGNPDKSLLYQQVHSGAMPPGKKDRLSDVELTMVQRWIADGAKPSLGDTQRVEFVTQLDVIPIMLRRCTACHGQHRQESGLDLRTKTAMVKGGKAGPTIVPGNATASLLVKKIATGRMPPPTRLVEACVKPVEKHELELIEKWLDQGAREVSAAAEAEPKDTLVTDKDRDFWAFKPPAAVRVPTLKEAARVRNPIDHFIVQKLHERGLSLAPEAEKAVLLRRAFYDLTGLPPSPEEAKAFLDDPSPKAYEAMIDRLLASPRYGERWGRYWLDLAGYADSEGKREQDLPRPHAWRYRDYVVQAFNNDKPYDRFLLEQLAGDELADYERAKEITPMLYDNLVATGFLRMVPDGTWANITGTIPDRLEVIADEIDVLGSSVMGLTMKCARCHSHKFDPIPQRDYYRLLAVFKGALDEYDWLKPDVKPGLGPESIDVLPGRLLSFVTTAERQAWEAKNAAIDREMAVLQTALKMAELAAREKIVGARLTQLPDVLREDLKVMLAVAPSQRNEVQRYLAAKFEKQLTISHAELKKLDDAFAKQANDAEQRLAALQGRRPPEPKIQALWDRGSPSPTYIYRRGNADMPGKIVDPGVPAVLTNGKTAFHVVPPFPGKTGRRLAFAKWLIQPDHPLTARVAVNRIWKHHFGKGIVTSLGNFGKSGTPPTHPELLDWLAQEFTREGWSIKSIHRTIMCSATYRQSSAIVEATNKIDPTNMLYSRMPMTRLDAESLYDALLLVAGKLDETRGGPADTVHVRGDGLVTPNGIAKGWRRLIYVQQTRKQLPTHLEVFDFPQLNPNCIERRDSTVAPQALHLMNNAMVERLAADFARRVEHDAGSDLAKQIDVVYMLALTRKPSSQEVQLGRAVLTRFAEEFSKQPGGDAKGKALATYCHAILNSAGFLYVD